MTIPSYQDLMLTVLEFVGEKQQVKFSELVEALSEKLKLSEDEKAELLPSGGQSVFRSRVGWAKTYLKKAGLIDSPQRGIVRITEIGQQILAKNPETINNQTLMKFDKFRNFVNKKYEDKKINIAKPTEENEATPDELIRLAYKEIENSLASELLERILGLSPSFFEHFIVKLLLAMGYGGSTKDSGKALGKSGDNGVDGVIDQDPLGLDQVYIQAKKYSRENKIGSADIRDFFGSLDRHKANKGLFITTSSFSASAIETAELLSKRIVLIDGRKLAKLMIRYNVGCRIENTLHIKKVDEDFFDIL